MSDPLQQSIYVSGGLAMSEQRNPSADSAKAVVRRNTEEVQGRGNFDLFGKLFADKGYISRELFERLSSMMSGTCS
jgi:hypothetical protein